MGRGLPGLHSTMYSEYEFSVSLRGGNGRGDVVSSNRAKAQLRTALTEPQEGWR